MMERGITAWIWDQLDEASLGSAWFWTALAGILVGMVELLTLGLPGLQVVLFATWALVFISGWRHALTDCPSCWHHALCCYRATGVVARSFYTR